MRNKEPCREKFSETVFDGKTGEKAKSITSKKAGRILTEVGLAGTANKIMSTIAESIQTEPEKNETSPQKE